MHPAFVIVVDLAEHHIHISKQKCTHALVCLIKQANDQATGHRRICLSRRKKAPAPAGDDKAIHIHSNTHAGEQPLGHMLA